MSGHFLNAIGRLSVCCFAPIIFFVCAIRRVPHCFKALFALLKAETNNKREFIISDAITGPSGDRFKSDTHFNWGCESAFAAH